MKTLPLLCCFLLLSFSSPYALDWEKEIVDLQGSKPALVLDQNNNPVIAYMLESFSGFVKLAKKENGIWTIDDVSEGYFYGPLDVTLNTNDEPFICYHDHTTEDQTIASKQGDIWEVNPIPHPGHDGWDNNIRFAPDGTLHTLTTDPSGFGGEGLEFASLINGNWQVEVVGTGPVMYAEGVSLAIDTQNRPHISYHNSTTLQLFYGIRDSILWDLSPADEEPETGMFSSIVLTASDEPVISYIAFNSDGDAEIKITSKVNDNWENELVDTLSHLTTGFLFARNATCIALDSLGNPYVAYTDETSIKLAHKIDGQWLTETVDTIENLDGIRFGQQVDLEFGTDGTIHLVSFDVTSESPLYGNIMYYKAAGTTKIRDWNKK